VRFFGVGNKKLAHPSARKYLNIYFINKDSRSLSFFSFSLSFFFSKRFAPMLALRRKTGTEESKQRFILQFLLHSTL